MRPVALAVGMTTALSLVVCPAPSVRKANAAVGRGALQALLRRDARPRADATQSGARPCDSSPVRERRRAKEQTARLAEAAFQEWWKETVNLEGSLQQWAANPANRYDRGGRANYGVTERTFMAHASDVGLPKTVEAFEGMTPDEAERIGRLFWRGARVHEIHNPGVALVVGDWYWGSHAAAWPRVKDTLRGMGHEVPQGKRLDEETIAVLNSAPPRELICKLSAARLQHHRDIVSKNPAQALFLAGWQRRTEVRLAQAERISDLEPAGDVNMAGGDGSLPIVRSASMQGRGPIAAWQQGPARVALDSHAIGR